MKLLFSEALYAHGWYEPLPKSLFEIKWDWDPTLIFFAVLSFFYLRGLRKFGKRRAVKNWQVGLFFTGVAICALSLSPPIDPLADQLFFMHMIQHLLFVLIGIPLMLFGVPFFVTIRGMPLWVRRNLYFPILRQRTLMRLLKFIQLPIPSLLLFEALFLLWHVPYFYNLALFNDWFHLLEHASFAVSAMFLWRNIVAPHPIKSSLPLPARMLFLLLMMCADIGLSSYLTFSDHVIYGYEGIPQPAWWKDGYLIDQQLGGLIMWVPGGTVYFLAMTICFFVWAQKEMAPDVQRRALLGATS